ncbi:MAG: type II secretion system inner membrane protein GspF [Magnetococcales bacterium]|nr:type II secretion system inner membrane protein GspF [Magnetococcales bacterium]
MGAYEFTALDQAGRTRKGVMEADNPRAVRSQLVSQGLVPLNVEEVKHKTSRFGGTREPGAPGGAAPPRLTWRRGMAPADLALFTRQMATMVRSGSPVEEALGVVAEQTAKPRVKSILLGVRSRVREGQDLAAALGYFPHVFSELYRASVAAGEHSGKLGPVLENLADFAENSQDLKQRVVLALIYPTIVSLVAVGIISVLLVYVVPQVVQVFVDFKRELPALTKMLIALSDFVRRYLWFLLGGAAALPVVLHLILRRPGAKRAWHLLLLKIPLISTLTRGLNTARFVRTFGVLSKSGVAVLDGLNISARVVANIPMRQAVEEAAARVREGTSLHMALARPKLFPPMTINLIASGEASGDLAGMLDHAANAQERELRNLIATLMGLLEPLMILVMGVVVLLIVLAILMPVFELNQLIKT